MRIGVLLVSLTHSFLVVCWLTMLLTMLGMVWDEVRVGDKVRWHGMGWIREDREWDSARG
jgi:hypothetical protein